MLDGKSGLVARALPGCCEDETKWVCMTYRVGVEIEVEGSNGKRSLDFDIEDEEILKKITKVCCDYEGNNIIALYGDDKLDMVSLTLDPSDTDSNGIAGYRTHHRQAVGEDEQANLDSLIPPIGADLTANCLLRLPRSEYNTIACLNSSFRRLIRSGTIYRIRRNLKVVEHWVYFSCRLLEWVAFHPDTCRWLPLPRMNSNECFICSDKESLAVGTDLLVFGRDMMSHIIYNYSILTHSWSSGMSMNDPRCLFGSASLGEIAILAGGCDSRGQLISSAEMFNSEDRIWVTLPSMNKPRKMCSGVFMDGKFYVIGGIGRDGKTLTCGEEYDLRSRTWKVILNMYPENNHAGGDGKQPTAAQAPPLVAVVNNQLFSADHAGMELKRYNKASKVWESIGRLPERSGSMNGWGLAFRACGDKLIVIGGPRDRNEGTCVEINSWVPNEEGPPQWVRLAEKQSGSFVYNCAVMGC